MDRNPSWVRDASPALLWRALVGLGGCDLAPEYRPPTGLFPRDWCQRGLVVQQTVEEQALPGPSSPLPIVQSNVEVQANRI
jgi:hypothetical protein